MKIIGFVLIFLGAYVIVLNAWLPIQYWVLKWRERSRSTIPFIGGVLASGGMLLTGSENFRSVFWLPLVLDVGCAPMVLYAAFKLIGRKSSKID